MNYLKNVIIVSDVNYINGGAAKVAINTAQILEKENDINVYFFSAVNKQEKDNNTNIKYVYTNQEEALNDKNRLRGFINGIWNNKAKKNLVNC